MEFECDRQPFLTCHSTVAIDLLLGKFSWCHDVGPLTGWKPIPRLGSRLPDRFIKVVEDVF